VKINSPINAPSAEPLRARTAPQPAPARPEAAETAQVAIPAPSASVSSRLQQIQGSLGSESPVDAQRVAEIKQAIAEGRFKINPERIADGLLNSVRQMLAERA